MIILLGKQKKALKIKGKQDPNLSLWGPPSTFSSTFAIL